MMKMNRSNLSQDGNRSSIHGLYCTTNVNGVYHQIAILALNIPLSFAAFIGNVMILLALKKVSSLRSSSKVLLASLASTDLCVGLVTQPLYIAYKLSLDHSKRCFYFQIIYGISSCVFAGVSLLTLTAISVDRLIALLMGLRYRRHVVTLKKLWMFVISFCLYAIVGAMLFLYNFRVAIYIIFITVLLCFTTSTFCYTNIYFKLRRHLNQAQEQFHLGQLTEGRTPLNIARYRKTVSSALWVQMVLVACYLPYVIVVAISAILGFRSPSLHFAWSVALSLLMFNSSLNPILYCWKIQHVGRAVKSTINYLRCC